MQFESPIAFCLFFFLPLLFNASIFARLNTLPPFSWFVNKSSSSEILLATRTLVTEIPLSLRARLALIVPGILRIAIWSLFILALARPQQVNVLGEDNANARDLMFLVDASGSMAALDFTENGEHVDRLTVLKSVVLDFVKKRQGDRLGLIVFGDEVYTQSPLTTDHEVVNAVVSALEIGMAGDGTALGDAVAVALRRMRDVPASSKAIILITDGMRTAGAIDPRDAAELAKTQGTKIYTIGIGSNQPAPFKIKNMLGLNTIEYRELPLDEKTLKEIASTTGGKFFNARNTEELAEIYQEIDKLETRTEKTVQYTEIKELFIFPLALGITLLVVLELLNLTVFRTMVHVI